MRRLTALAAVALLGCGPGGAEPLLTWWGPVQSDSGRGYADGRPVEGQVLAGGTTAGGRELLHLAFVEGGDEVGCAGYVDYLWRVRAVQEDVLATIGAAADQASWREWVCQSLDGAARDAFGGRGRFVALHALLETTGGGPGSDIFRPAPPGGGANPWLGADLLQDGQYVARLYERQRHGASFLPPEDSNAAWIETDFDPVDSCETFVGTLIGELREQRTTYPDRASFALQVATNRSYHLHNDFTRVPLREGEQEVGFTLPGWQDAGTAPVPVVPTVFARVARAVGDFPYEEIIFSTEGRPLTTEPCPALGELAPLVFPELPEFEAQLPAP